MTTKYTKFESKTCSRCGGSGNYSFNLMHGTMCYGCSGSGEQYTKRGKEAQRFFAESLTVPAPNLGGAHTSM
jgi:DnaJ-class molecular chaperone